MKSAGRNVILPDALALASHRRVDAYRADRGSNRVVDVQDRRAANKAVAATFGLDYSRSDP